MQMAIVILERFEERNQSHSKIILFYNDSHIFAAIKNRYYPRKNPLAKRVKDKNINAINVTVTKFMHQKFMC